MVDPKQSEIKVKGLILVEGPKILLVAVGFSKTIAPRGNYRDMEFGRSGIKLLQICLAPF